jgi:hypothetical protein
MSWGKRGSVLAKRVTRDGLTFTISYVTSVLNKSTYFDHLSRTIYIAFTPQNEPTVKSPVKPASPGGTTRSVLPVHEL